MAMMTAKDLLNLKEKNEIWSVSPQSTVQEALSRMADKDIGALLVLENGQLVGVFSERDFARSAHCAGKCSLTVLIRDVMTKRVVTVESRCTVDECMAVMSAEHIRHLPIMEENKLVGLLSIGDLVKAVISNQESTIASLERYITGTDYGKV